ncbi:MAG: PEP-CTERM sorting domain-containing protein [Thermodesulfobacteriota bacterium]
MRSTIKIFLVAIVISLFFAGQVGANGHGGNNHNAEQITITDLYDDDNDITGSNLLGTGNYTCCGGCCTFSGPVFQVFEDYNEKYLTPYPSHDGYAIVNSAGQFFDKVVTFQNICGGGSCTCSGNCGSGTCPCCGCSGNEKIWAFYFEVKNTSPYDWSDYHFEFWNKDFTTRYTNFPLLQWQDQIFQNESFDGSILQFWAPDWQDHSETNKFLLLIDLASSSISSCASGCCSGSCCYSGSFGIRQVATTIPEPATMVLVGSGLLGAATFRRLRNK